MYISACGEVQYSVLLKPARTSQSNRFDWELVVMPVQTGYWIGHACRSVWPILTRPVFVKTSDPVYLVTHQFTTFLCYLFYGMNSAPIFKFLWCHVTGALYKCSIQYCTLNKAVCGPITTLAILAMCTSCITCEL